MAVDQRSAEAAVAARPAPVPLTHSGGTGVLARLLARLQAEPGLTVRAAPERRWREQFYDSADGWFRQAGAVLMRRTPLPADETGQAAAPPPHWVLASALLGSSELARQTRLSQEAPADEAPGLPPGPLRDYVAAGGGPTEVVCLFEAERREGELAAYWREGKALTIRYVESVYGPGVPPEQVSALGVSGPARGRLGNLRTALLLTPGLAPGAGELYVRLFLARGRPFPASPPAPALVQPGDQFGDAVRRICGHHLAEMRAHLPGAALGLDEAGVHDLRVAARRLHCALCVFAPALPAPEATELVTELRWLRSHLGAVRDLDVYLESLPTYAAEMAPEDAAQLDHFAAQLYSARNVARQELLAALHSPRTARLLDRLGALSREAVRPLELTPAAAQPLPAAADQLVRTRLEVVMGRGRKAVRNPDVQRLHRLRIACKTLRYVAEWLAPLHEDWFRTFILRVQELQELLGRHHDAVVAVRRLRAMVAEIAADERRHAGLLFVLGQLVSQKHRVMREAAVEFPQRWGKFRRRKCLRRLLSTESPPAVSPAPPPESDPAATATGEPSAG